jgi:hypothetical protein
MMSRHQAIINGKLLWVDSPDPTPEELAEELAENETKRLMESAEYHRDRRNFELFQSDWTQVADIQGTMNDDTKSKWIIYRQSLRDLPEHANWPDLEYGDWPLDLNGNNNSGMDPP